MTLESDPDQNYGYPSILFEKDEIFVNYYVNDGGRTFVSPTGWIDEFNNGEGMNKWLRDDPVPPTPIPAFDMDAQQWEEEEEE